MVTKSRITKRAVLGLLVIDMLFVLLFGAAYTYLMGVPWRMVGLTFFASLVVREVAFAVLAHRMIGPSEELYRDQTRRARPPSVDAIRRADRLLYAFPFRAALLIEVFWVLQVIVMALVKRAFPTTSGTELQFGTEVVHVLLAGVVFGGAFGITYPFQDWIVADGLGKNSVLARQRGIELERAMRPIPTRIASAGIWLCGVPLLLMAALGFATQARNQAERARLEAELVVFTLQQAGSASAALDRWDPSPFGGRITAFTVESAGPIHTRGGPAPKWLDASWVTSAQGAGIANPERSVFLRAASLADGGTVGAIARVDSTNTEFLLATALAALTLVMFGIVSGSMLARSVASPLEVAAAAVRRIVEEGDLSRMESLPVAQQDEVGLLIGGVNELVDNMRALSKAATSVGEGNLDVPITGEGELQEAFRRMVENLRQAVQQMHGTAVELGSAAEELFAASQEQEAAAISHSSGMVEITQTMDSLSRSAGHVAESVQGVLQNAERTLENTDQMVARIGTLTGQANRISDILNGIREIADRSDLLALNGSLEATRAGDAGRGFALVAGEMRRLAERVTISVEDIKGLVAEIRESGASTVVATEESKKLAHRTTETARSITLVTQQQRTSTEQVTQSVRAVADVVTQTATAAVQTRASAEALKAHANSLTALVQRFQLRA